ncbi:MAG: hypothetical protein ABIZ91_14845, partial [Gemmatimonadaceae bacterium]
WFASHQIGGPYFGFLDTRVGGIALWLLLPLVAVAGDLVEDVAQLRFLALHERDEAPSPFVTVLGFVGSIVKFAAFVPALLLTMLAGALGMWKVMWLGQSTGWRGTVALLISALVAATVAGIVISIPLYRWRTKSERERSHDAMRDMSPTGELRATMS